ncbi:hypothetical protein [Nostoc sp.]
MRSQLFFFYLNFFHLSVKLSIYDTDEAQTQHLPESYYHYNDRN